MSQQPRYKDSLEPLEERVEDLLQRMTLEEKLAQLGTVWITALVKDDQFDAQGAREILKNGTGQVTRIGASTGLRPNESAALMNQVQRVLLEQTRLGIPAVVHEESTGGYCARGATVFPQGIGLGGTWDPALVRRVSEVIRQQMRAVGARHTLAPVLDVARDARWGRVEETYGEDPYLNGQIGTAYVQGLQGKDLKDGVVCTGKHFLGYGYSEAGFNQGAVHLGPRELREVFAEPFAAAIRDAGLASMMNSYSSIDGLPCAGSKAILTDLLRDELGFDGTVVADYWAVTQLYTHHFTAADKAEAAVQALTAGIDIELPVYDCYAELADLVREGEFDESIIDLSVRRVLKQKFQLGLFENPYVDPEAALKVFDTASQRALARRAAERSIALLTNDGLLPLSPEVGSVAVIGPAADDRRLLQGDYHYPAHVEIIFQPGNALARWEADWSAPEVRQAVAALGIDLDAAQAGDEATPQVGGAFDIGPHYTPHVTPLAALRTMLGDDKVRYARGCDVQDPKESDIEAAVAAAQGAEVALVFVGSRSGLTPAATVGEFCDATSLELTGAQQELVQAVIATGTPTVVVLVGGRVFAVPWIAQHANALLEAWCPGEEGGNAIADILFGLVNPGGRLPVSMPRATGQVPIYYYRRNDRFRMGPLYRKYVDCESTPLFPFGHGLSYTTFEYRDLRIEAGSTEDMVTVSVALSNTGDRDGDQVVQLYMRDEVASTARPIRQLVGFVRTSLKAGETRTVAFEVHPSRLAFYDPEMRFVTEPGAFTFMIGASSMDIRAKGQVTLTGEVAEYRQREIVATEVTVS